MPSHNSLVHRLRDVVGDLEVEQYNGFKKFSLEELHQLHDLFNRLHHLAPNILALQLQGLIAQKQQTPENDNNSDVLPYMPHHQHPSGGLPMRLKNG